MKLGRDKMEFRLPERIEAYTCHFGIWSAGDPLKNPDSWLMLCPQVSIEDISVGTNDILGIPTEFAVRHGDKHDYLRLRPVPDKDYFARLIYNPARKEV